MVFRRFGVGLVIAMLVAACGQYEGLRSRRVDDEQRAYGEQEVAPGMLASKRAAPAAPSAAPPLEESQASGGAQPAQVPVPTERKLIRNGNLSLEVASVEKSLTEVASLVQSLGGYISNQWMSEDEFSRKTGSISCRIPSERLDEALEKIKSMGKVENVSVTTDDITDQYFDLQIRIQNQKELERRLLELLKRPTNKLSDLLEVERELARVRNDIDSMEGRKRLWDNQVAYSTLVVNVREPLPAIASEEGGVLRTLLRSFSHAGNNFVLTVAGIIAASGAVVPIALVVGLVVWVIIRLWKGRKKQAA